VTARTNGDRKLAVSRELDRVRNVSRGGAANDQRRMSRIDYLVLCSMGALIALFVWEHYFVEDARFEFLHGS